MLGESGDPDGAAIAPRLAAERYGLEILAEDVEDHPDNQTRFVLVARRRVPKPTGHDKTSIVCFQRADHPGSLHGILGPVRGAQHQPDQARVPPDQAGPRRLLLRHRPRAVTWATRWWPTACATCTPSLAGVKFLGSYPAAGDHGPEQRRQADDAWQAADDWLRDLRQAIGVGRPRRGPAAAGAARGRPGRRSSRLR